MEPQTMEQMPEKKSVYNKERYLQNKEEILKHRRERYRTINKKDLNIKVSTGTFTLYFVIISVLLLGGGGYMHMYPPPPQKLSYRIEL